MSAVILVVDDSAIQRKIFATVLKSSGYTVLVAENGLQGVQIALQEAPHLILMDIAMPEMDGLTATRELRTYPQMAAIPIIAVTGSTAPEDVQTALAAGYNAVVDKASGNATLLATIQQWLS